MGVFESVFDDATAKNVEVSPGAGWACQGTKRRQIPAWGSSTPQHGQKRRRGKDEDFLVQKSLTLWPPKFTFRTERNVFPSFFSCFPLFFVARLPVGENTSLLPCGSNTSFAQGASGKLGPDLLALFERRDVHPRQTMRQLRKVCHAEGVLCLSSWQQSWTNPASADEAFLARCWSGCLPQPGKAKSLLRKTWQTYRQGYKPQRLYK